MSKGPLRHDPVDSPPLDMILEVGTEPVASVSRIMSKGGKSPGSCLSGRVDMILEHRCTPLRHDCGECGRDDARHDPGEKHECR